MQYKKETVVVELSSHCVLTQSGYVVESSGRPGDTIIVLKIAGCVKGTHFTEVLRRPDRGE